MKLAFRRSWLIPVLAVALAASVATATHLEQERQYEDVRHLYETHASLAGSLVRAAAQEAAWATGLAYSLAEDGLAALAGALGPVPDPVDCDAVGVRLPDLALWATRDASGALRGCFGPLAPAARTPFVAAVLAAPEPEFVDTPLTRRHGLLCVAVPAPGGGTVACRDRAPLDRLRGTVGLGPFLSSLEGREVDYVVIQDAGGILAASPRPGALSTWDLDPLLASVLQGPPGTVASRLVEGPGSPVFELVGDIELGDGSRAVLRTGLDASGLADLRRRIDHRQGVMLAMLASLVLLSVALAAVLDRADRRRRQHAESLRRQQAEAAHWQSLGEMAATVAHEVRNPLNAIGMALQRLGTEFPPAPDDAAEFQDLLKVASDASRRVDRVVGDFLELGRPLVLDLRPRDSREMLAEALAPLALRAGAEGRRLVTDVRCQGPVVADGQRLAQVLANLAGNALDAVPPGGEVRVTALREGEGIRITVADDGPGMDAGTLARVQAPFVTTKASGTGLGLPLARRLVEAHGGTLVLESEPGAGTRATVTLPGRDRAREDR